MLTKQKVKILIATGHCIPGEMLETELNALQTFQPRLTNARNIGLLAEIENMRADVVVILTEDNEEPGIVSHVFDAFPGVIVIVFNHLSREAVLCKQTLSKQVMSKANLVELLQSVSSGENCSYWGKVS